MKFFRNLFIYLTIIFMPLFAVIACSNPGGNPTSSEESNNSSEQYNLKELNSFTYRETLSTSGRLHASKDIRVSSKISEEIDQILVDEGSKITKGQKLIQLDTRSRQINRNRSYHQMKRANVEKKNSKRDYQRKKTLLQKDLISQREYDQSKTAFERARENYRISRSNFEQAKLNLSHTSIKSPLKGILEQHLIKAGELVQPGQPLARLLRLDPLEVRFYIDDRQRSHLNTGDTVLINARSETTPKFGTIEQIARDVTETNMLYEVTASLSNSEYSLTAGKSVTVKTTLRQIPNTVKIPLEYIDRQKDEQRIILFNPAKNTLHTRTLQSLAYKQEHVIVQRTWPKKWKLAPGGYYSETSDRDL